MSECAKSHDGQHGFNGGRCEWCNERETPQPEASGQALVERLRTILAAERSAIDGVVLGVYVSARTLEQVIAALSTASPAPVPEPLIRFIEREAERLLIDSHGFHNSLRLTDLHAFAVRVIEAASPAPASPRCAQCGQSERQHCQLDEPGVDHRGDCPKMHHEFKQPASPQPLRGHIDSDCEVVRGVGWMCTCETPEQKAIDAAHRAEVEAERDAESQPASPPGERPDQRLIQALRAAFDDMLIAEVDRHGGIPFLHPEELKFREAMAEFLAVADPLPGC